MSAKKKKDFDKGADVRHASSRTEIQTGLDVLTQELLVKNEKFDPSLVVVQGDLMGHVFRIKEGENIIGRHPKSEIELKQRIISTKHAVIKRLGEHILIEDLNSSNGTVVNKGRLSKEYKLKRGDLVKVGTYVFKYVDRSLDIDFAEQLHLQGSTDLLTGAFNKGYVMKALASSIEIAKGGFPLSLIVTDLDHFKKVNDTHGHLAGDYVLKETCRLIKESVLRPEDILGRFGGEEFVVILPDINIENALRVAERIRTTLQVHSFEYADKKIPVTTSIGVCEWSPEFPNANAMFEKTDQLLYQAKMAGRNRVCS